MIHNKVLKVVTEIAAAIDEGYQIIWTAEPKLLRWTWLCFKQEGDQEISQDWSIRLSEVKRLSSLDPRSDCLLDFVTGKINAKETLVQIEKLEKLKAFW